MEQYIGTKIVHAEPVVKLQGIMYSEGEIVPRTKDAKYSYKVQYPDGYVSWCPKEAFEEAYRPADGMPFGLAIEAAKKGKKIARRGWNGKSQYVELAYCISYKNHAAEVINANHCNIGNRALAFVGTSGVQLGWLASQADMLADDWYIVE